MTWFWNMRWKIAGWLLLLALLAIPPRSEVRRAMAKWCAAWVGWNGPLNRAVAKALAEPESPVMLDDGQEAAE